MVAEWGSMQHGHTALDARGDMSNAAGAYRWHTPTMSLPSMSYINTYVDDTQFGSLTCTSHATQYLSTPACPPNSFLGADYLSWPLLVTGSRM